MRACSRSGNLNDALGLTAMAAEVLADPRTGRNGRHSLIAQLRQSVFGRLAGYEDVNDADRLGHDPGAKGLVDGRRGETPRLVTRRSEAIEGSP
jgi:DDE family transposase